MTKFMLILHETPGRFRKLSPEQMQQTVERYRSWVDRKLRSTDRLVASDKLKEEGGKVLTKQNGRLSVVDGPYSEAKEVVGGFFLFRAESYNEAIELIADCPHLDFGRIEIRQTDAMGCNPER